MALRNVFGDIALDDSIDISTNDLLRQILIELKLINKHMEQTTDTEFVPDDLE